MPIPVGAHLGPYEILGAIAVGGMGEVYRAKDPRLGREVAIKIPASDFSERSAREARLAASLNHPNICHIYDVGPEYLVMELVEGQTLAERLQRGSIPLGEAIGIARQIADALDAAHEKGIVHRDLKPGNIKIRSDGTVKVLDFGLAKAIDVVSAAGNPNDSATVTLDQLTRTGAIVGTPAYMAPEQALGKPVDKRVDIWAFGVVLYEMVTGRRLFHGESVADTLAAVLTKQPEWSLIPPSVRRLLRRCLERDPKQRLRDIGDALFLLEDAPSAARSNWPWKVGTAALAIVAAFALLLVWISTRHAAPPLLRLNVDFGENAAISARFGASMALSPDGSQLVFPIKQQAAQPRLLAIRRLDQAKAMSLAGTEGAQAPFFSPDGKAIAFFAGGKLKKIDVNGGGAVTLCDAPSPREGSWGDDDNIVFAASNQDGLWRVPASGGTPQAITELDKKRGEWTHRYPQVLPGAKAVLFADSPNSAGEGTIEVYSFKTRKHKTLVQTGAYGRYLPSGHLVYIHQRTLFAAPMDAGRMELTDPPVAVLDDVSFHPAAGIAEFTFSQSGTFAYIATSPEDQLRPIGVMDQQGKVELLPIPRARYTRARISPDGKRLAVTIDAGAAARIWIYEWDTQRFSRLAFANGNSTNPVWTPDAKYLLFSSDAQTPGPGIFCMRGDGTGTPQRLVEGSGLVPSSVSAYAGLVYEATGGLQAGLWHLPLEASDATHLKPGVPERFPESPLESPASISPDGRWLAYVNAQSGIVEVFVRPFPKLGPGGPWQLSTGGTSPVWSRTSRQVFYHGAPDSQIKVADYVATGDSFSPARPHSWNDTRVERFDLMPDGKRAVMVPSYEQKEATHATFLFNFADDLRRRVPAGR